MQEAFHKFWFSSYRGGVKMKCTACKKGTLIQNGPNVTCTNCSARWFAMTQDYLHDCCVLLSTLVSNLEFSSYTAYNEYVLMLIATHLPLLHKHIESCSSNRDAVINNIMSNVHTNAINIIVNKVKGLS